jgi:hypothetical protein
MPAMSDASSVGSTRSLCSCGSPTMGDMDSQDNASSRKATTHWELEEERELISFLVTHKSEAGDTMNFKSSVFSDAAIHLNRMYPAQKCAPKSQSSCKTKWSNVSVIIYLSTTAAHIITAKEDL